MESVNEIISGLGNVMSKHIGVFSLGNIASAVIIAIVCIIAVKLIMKLVSRLVEKTPFDNTLNSFIKSAIRIVLYFVAVIIIADSLGIPVTSLLAVFSVIGLAVSLAVQGSLTNLAGGVSILASKPFVNGDFVEVGGVSGTVQEIGLIYTRLSTPDNKIIYVPNSEISSSKIVNYTSEDKRMLIINVTASYDSPIDNVKYALQTAINETELISDKKNTVIGVTEYGNSSIGYVVKAWVDTANYWSANFALTENIKHVFDREKIEMTYDHINVHMINK